MISAPISPWDSSSSLQVDVIDTTRSHEWMNLGHIQCENSMQQFATVLRLNNSLKRCASVVVVSISFLLFFVLFLGVKIMPMYTLESIYYVLAG